MKQSYKKLMSGAAVVAACLTLAFAFSGCKDAQDQLQGLAGLGGEGGGIITYSARASGSGSTAKINLNFDAAVSGLKADDITFDATPAGAATAGALTGSGKRWSLAVNVTADAAAAVSISKAGIEDGTKGVTLRRYPSSGITYTAFADGGPATTSTKIDFEFGADVDITIDDIMIGEMPGAANKTVLTGSGKNWTLEITVTKAGAASVSVIKEGIDRVAQGITLYGPVAYTAVANGSAAVTSTKIDFAFGAAVAGLTPADITISGGAATKGSLTGSGTAWSLALTAVNTAGAATVTVNRAGIESGARSITLYNSFIANAASPDLSIKFGITTTGTTVTADVDATFRAVHDYLATNPPVSGTGNTTKIGNIALGDYVDLVSLTIGADAAISNAELQGHGKLLRLIVVGINSFKVANNKGVENSSAPTHLVFQFQNFPVKRNMNSTNTNAGGYAASGMKAYVTGDFLTGLKAATGLTDALLWAPERKVSRGGNPVTDTDTITDKLWLPTEWEMFGIRKNSSQQYEIDAGQARLEYYQANAGRIKYDSGNDAYYYWEASTASASASAFCFVDPDGYTGAAGASNNVGVAPAFCVR